MSTATLAMLLSLPLVCLAAAEAPPKPPITLKTEFRRYSLSADGKSAELTGNTERQPVPFFDLFGPPPGPPAKPEARGGAQ